MRTKTLLIAAAGALAAGVITSQAQVYSQNVVGYVNLFTSAATNNLITVPFVIGVSNGANEIWPLVSPGVPSLPDSSELLTWTGSGYITYYSDSTSPTLWDDANGNYLAYSPTLPVGQGFFLQPFANYTNTFVGTVAVGVGATNNTVLTGNYNYLLAPVVPYGGYLTNGTSTGGGIALSSLNGLPDSSELLIWTGSGYNTYYSDSTSPSLWDDANGNYLSVPPSVTVGEGFFLDPFSTFTWTEGLSAQ
jgi:hypothetical protein